MFKPGYSDSLLLMEEISLGTFDCHDIIRAPKFKTLALLTVPGTKSER